MIWPLIKSNFKEHKFIWILLTSIFIMYFIIILSMYDPESLEAMQAMIAMLPIELVRAMGFEDMGTTLLTYLSGYMYGFLIYLFPMILTIVMNHRMIAGLVDKGSMAYLLTTPHSRIQIVTNQMAFGLFAIIDMFVVTTLVTISFASILFPGELEIGKFLYLNLHAIILYSAIGAICFFGSALANEAKQSLSIGVGIPVAFLVLQMIANAGDSLSWVKYFTMYTLFDPNEIIAFSARSTFSAIALIGIAVILYGAAILVFDKKNLYV